MNSPPDLTSRWRRRYERLIGLYPASYRLEYAEPTLQLFDDIVRDAPPERKRGVMLAAMFDTMASIVQEQARDLQKRLKSQENPMTKKPSFAVRHRLPLIIGGAILVIAIAVSAPTIVNATTSAVRLAQINGIYSSLKLDNSYFVSSENVFGDKRAYTYDKGRTESSSRTYAHEANVDTTVASVRAKIEAAGYTYIGEPYPGSLQTQLHFKSKNDHYIRLTVESGPRSSAAMTGDEALLTTYDATHSPNDGPSIVTIKVNLDDNNE